MLVRFYRLLQHLNFSAFILSMVPFPQRILNPPKFQIFRPPTGTGGQSPNYLTILQSLIPCQILINRLSQSLKLPKLWQKNAPGSLEKTTSLAWTTVRRATKGRSPEGNLGDIQPVGKKCPPHPGGSPLPGAFCLHCVLPPLQVLELQPCREKQLNEVLLEGIHPKADA